MEYLFAPQIPPLADGEIFKGKDAGGYVEGGVLRIYDPLYDYVYRGGWIERGYACGACRVPALYIEDLEIVNEQAWRAIAYAAPAEEV